MANASDWLERNFLSHLLGSGQLSKPSVVAIALCSGVPIDSNTGSTIPEIANAGAYARQSLNPSATNWLDPVDTNGVCVNLVTVTFPTATADWGWVSGVAFCSSATYGAGNVFAYGSLTTPKNVGLGDTLSFASGQLALTFG